MGGMDLMDSFLGRYKIKIERRMWCMRMFYHIMNMAITNSWILYKQSHPNISLYDSRAELAKILCLYKTPTKEEDHQETWNEHWR